MSGGSQFSLMFYSSWQEKLKSWTDFNASVLCAFRCACQCVRWICVQ